MYETHVSFFKKIIGHIFVPGETCRRVEICQFLVPVQASDVTLPVFETNSLLPPDASYLAPPAWLSLRHRRRHLMKKTISHDSQQSTIQLAIQEQREVGQQQKVYQTFFALQSIW